MELKTWLLRPPPTHYQTLEETNENRRNDLLLEAQLECDRANETFEALLSISQIESGDRRSRFTWVELNCVILTVAEIYTNVAGDRGQSLQIAKLAEENQQSLRGDRELLTQLFANLVENAINHCPEGTRIAMSLRADAQGFHASVCDDGPGIPYSEYDKVSRRQYRLDKSRTTLGSGLGLSLVKAIVALHMGRIFLVAGNPGLHVHIDLPRGD